MSRSIGTFRRFLAAALVLGSLAAPAAAEEKPIRVLVGFAPGSTSDVVARIVADKLRAALATPVIVENRAGANGMLAAEAVKAAPPDGRTLMLAPIAVTVFAPLTHANLRYDPVKDLAPLSLAANFQFALAVGAGSPSKTLADHLASMRGGASKAVLGVPVSGGPGHFLGVMVARATGIDAAFVPYKGGGPLVNDLMGNQVPAGIALVSDMIVQHNAGKVRMLATAGSQRTAVTPDVPTFKELGFPAIDVDGWHAFYTTAGTPRETVDRLSAAIASAVRAPEIRERLLALGLEPVGSTADELARRMVEDSAKWAPAVRASGFRAEP